MLVLPSPQLNPDQIGYYRIHYTPRTFAPLLTALKNNSDSLSPRDRLGLLNDAFALVRAQWDQANVYCSLQIHTCAHYYL